MAPLRTMLDSIEGSWPKKYFSPPLSIAADRSILARSTATSDWEMRSAAPLEPSALIFSASARPYTDERGRSGKVERVHQSAANEHRPQQQHENHK